MPNFYQNGCISAKFSHSSLLKSGSKNICTLESKCCVSQFCKFSILRTSCKKRLHHRFIRSYLDIQQVAYSSPSFQVLEVIQRVIRTILQKEKVMIIFHVLKKMRFPSVFCSAHSCIFRIFCLANTQDQCIMALRHALSPTSVVLTERKRTVHF